MCDLWCVCVYIDVCVLLLGVIFTCVLIVVELLRICICMCVFNAIELCNVYTLCVQCTYMYIYVTNYVMFCGSVYRCGEDIQCQSIPALLIIILQGVHG